jgi:hypothetical protein
MRRVLIAVAGVYLLGEGMLDLYGLAISGSFHAVWKGGLSRNFDWPEDSAGILLYLAIHLLGGAFCIWDSIVPRRT